MLDRVSLVCFTASYGVALAFEIVRLVFRLRARRLLMLGFTAAGLIAHTIYLVSETQRELSATPLSSWYHWCLLAAWLLASVFLVETLRRPDVSLGLFVLPLVLLLIGAGYSVKGMAPFGPREATLVWGSFHGLALLFGTVAVAMGFIAGTMYLVQAWRLKHKLLPLAGLRLPSLEVLQRANEGLLVTSTILLAMGVVAGMILNLVRHVAMPWTDPVVLLSLLLIAYLVAAALFNALYKPARAGQKVAYLTVASFVLLALVLAFVLFGPSQHSQPQTEWGQVGAKRGQVHLICRMTPAAKNGPVPFFGGRA